MRIKKLFAGVLAGAMALSTMVMGVGADTTVTGGTVSVTADSEWRSFGAVSADELLGDSGVSIGAVTSVTFTCDGDSTEWYAVYLYKTADGWTQTSGNATGSVTYYAEDAYLGDFVTSCNWGCFGVWNINSPNESDEFTLTLTYSDAYTDANTIKYYIDEDDLANSSYELTLVDSDGNEGTLTGNSYNVDYDDDGNPYYWVGVTLSDIPYDQEVTITGIEFFE